MILYREPAIERHRDSLIPSVERENLVWQPGRKQHQLTRLQFEVPRSVVEGWARLQVACIQEGIAVMVRIVEAEDARFGAIIRSFPRRDAVDAGPGSHWMRMVDDKPAMARDVEPCVGMDP